MSQESDPPTFEGESRLDRVDPAELFLEEWQPGVIPDLARFLDRVGPLNSSELSAVLRVDLCERWPTAERWPAENYLSRFPQLQSDRDACLDLIYWEFLVREQNGETPSPHEFCQRFPEYTESLLAQLGFHAALETLPSQSGSHMSSKSFSNVLQADADSAVSLVGKKFGRYQVLSLLGCGGMGEVYLALDSQLGRELALKVMNFQREDRHGVERFQREARIMAALQHPHLCAIYDFGEIDGRAYLTMPRLLGETLAERLKRVGPLSQLLAARISSQIARALHVMHQAGVVHRDLKPSNIMIDNHDQPVVLDFGLAWRDVPEDPRITVEGALTGTIAYLAPERIGAESGAPSPVCDVYSLGAILYEMLTGRLPFEGNSHQILRKVLSDPPKFPDPASQILDRRLINVCLRALAKDPAARFVSMEAFAEVLEACLADEPLRLLPPETPRRKWNGHRRGILLAGITLGIGLGLWWIVREPGWSLSRKTMSSTARAADLVQASTVWEGEFHFKGAYQGNDGTIRLVVAERSGRQFRGTMVNQPGNYGWHFAGTIDGDQVHWWFTEILDGYTPQENKGVIQAVVHGRSLSGEYNDPSDNSSATIDLKWKGQEIVGPDQH